jgi:glutaconate CoA-transferase, subunit A
VDRLIDIDAALRLVPDGALLAVGGTILHRKPMAFLKALAGAERRDLTVLTFAGSTDVEVLLAAGCVKELRTAYVGLGEHGFAPRFRSAAESGAVIDQEWSEWTLLGGLRAAMMGLPFLPTRAGLGSEVVADLPLGRVDDPFGSGTYLAIPPMRPDVAVLHAWRASPSGDVQFPWPPEHLWDVDVLMARAARSVVVTVEEIVESAAIAEDSVLTRLFGFEIDAVVHCPGGAWPTGSAPDHEPDHEALADYAKDGDLDRLWSRRPVTVTGEA